VGGRLGEQAVLPDEFIIRDCETSNDCRGDGGKMKRK